MNILILHQNFPGQFRQLTPQLLNRGHHVVSICSHDRETGIPCRTIRYPEPSSTSCSMSLGQQLWFEGLYRSEHVTTICSNLNQEGWLPDVILLHSGWGEALSIREVWPDVPWIVWPELWVRPEHGGHGLDPELPPPNLRHSLEQVGRNAITRLALDEASAWVLPTRHQANSLPVRYRSSKLHIIHEGIDTELVTPNHSVGFKLGDLWIDRNTPILTFVNRNLERLRGFDVFMRVLPHLQREWPALRVLIVGDSGKGYGSAHPSGRSWRDALVSELQGRIDMNRIHFLGRIPYPQLIALMQVSRVHVYLSYPFVLGWSLLEAMSCGCAIVGSKGMPVEEVIVDGVEGLLVPIHDENLLLHRINSLLKNPRLRDALGQNARIKALEYSQSITLPKLLRLIEGYDFNA